MGRKEIVTIENDHLLVGVKSKGAELCSIIDKKTNQEFLWQADPKYWGRHSCILFPFIGKLKHGQYVQDGRTYAMGQHGFVRDMEFTTTSCTDKKLSMQLESTEATFDMYPFHFTIEAIYTLIERKVSVEYIVHSKNDRDMPFSIGAHPAFNCPIDPVEDRSDYSLLFNKPEEAWSRCLDENGLINEEERLIMDNSDLLRIEEDLFDDDALIFEQLNSDRVTLLDSVGAPLWTFEFPQFPLLGIWSKSSEAPFVCIEPWYGIADTIHATGDLFQKEGIEVLKPKGSFSCAHHITIH